MTKAPPSLSFRILRTEPTGSGFDKKCPSDWPEGALITLNEDARRDVESFGQQQRLDLLHIQVSSRAYRSRFQSLHLVCQLLANSIMSADSAPPSETGASLGLRFPAPDTGGHRIHQSACQWYWRDWPPGIFHLRPSIEHLIQWCNDLAVVVLGTNWV